MRKFLYGIATGVLLVVLLYLQVRFNFVNETIDVAAASIEFAQQFTDRCDTTLCCEDCRSIPVTRVIDGDTFVSEGMRVRLYGVDTPEVGERCAAEATSRMIKLAGDSVRVQYGTRFSDRYGRRLSYVYTQGGASIDEKLIREGLGRAWTRDGQHVSTLSRIELASKLGSKGCLW